MSKQVFYAVDGLAVRVYNSYPLRFWLKNQGAEYNEVTKTWDFNVENETEISHKIGLLADKGIPAGAAPTQPVRPETDLFGAPVPAKKPVGAPEKAANKLAEALAELMAKPAVDVETVKAIIKEELKGFVAPNFTVTTERGEVKEVKGTVPAVFGKVLALAQARKNILLVGPAGCGKTHLAEMVAEALSLSFSFNSCSAGMSESHLSGYLLPFGDNGKFTYVAAEFVKRFENGGIHLLDEIDASDANTLCFINAALANGHFMVPQRVENPIVRRHKDFICMAAANTYGNGADRMYVGRTQLDAATLDRFRIGVVPMDYDENVEKALVAPEVLKWGKAVRKIISETKMRRIVSTRFLRDLTDMSASAPELYGDKTAWTETLTHDWSADERARIERI